MGNHTADDDVEEWYFFYWYKALVTFFGKEGPMSY
jgi:hypothetical protein